MLRRRLLLAWALLLVVALVLLLGTPPPAGLSTPIGRRAGTALLIALLVLVALRPLLRLATWRGRRQLLGAWRRLVRWEFWPPWAFYPPVALAVGVLGLRHRSLALVTAVNPGIPAGGFIGESKSDILRQLGEAAAPFVVVRAGEVVDEAERRVRAGGLVPPLVVKPDVGQRGMGVRIVGDQQGLRAALCEPPVDLIVQAFVPGREFGVFYARRPDAERGAILSITDKRLPALIGDGRRTLEELILADERAVCMARTYFAANAARLPEVPAAGERVTLVHIGTHCRGAIFLDGTALRTPAMEAAFERIARSFPGFHFGRFDVRVPSVEALQAGREISVIELNGLTSEMTHVYDPRIPLLTAWRTLGRQWALAFEIARANVARGARPARLADLAAALRAFRRHARRLPSAGG